VSWSPGPRTLAPTHSPPSFSPQGWRWCRGLKQSAGVLLCLTPPFDFHREGWATHIWQVCVCVCVCVKGGGERREGA